MDKQELFKIAEIIEHEKKFCQKDCCKNHLTIINGYLLKMYMDTFDTSSELNSQETKPFKDAEALRRSPIKMDKPLDNNQIKDLMDKDYALTKDDAKDKQEVKT